MTPKGIRNIIKWIKEKYGEELEIFITENGFSDEGGLNDTTRINYLAVSTLYTCLCRILRIVFPTIQYPYFKFSFRELHVYSHAHKYTFAGSRNDYDNISMTLLLPL